MNTRTSVYASWIGQLASDFAWAGILVAALTSPVLAASPSTKESSDLSKFRQQYDACVIVHLPIDSGGFKVSANSVTLAVDACDTQLMEVAGQYALDNPGTRNTQRVINELRTAIVKGVHPMMQYDRAQ